MKIAMPADLRRRLEATVRKAGRKEIGGVLMAEQLAPGHFRLIEFSVDSRTGSAAHFVRSVEEHQAMLSAFFERTGSDFGRFNYLGEWHSHPNHRPIPSLEDIWSMEDLVRGERNIDFALLMIVRARWSGLDCGATLFQVGVPPQPAQIAIERRIAFI